MSDPLTTPTETTGNSPGAILKRCREYHGLSLENASETTKIGISYLRALEEDQIREFANLTYLKGFLRIYAAYLGLNSDDMARMYDKQQGIKDEQAGTDTKAPEKIRPARRLASLQKLALPALLLLLILIIAVFFKRPPSEPPRTVQPVATATPAMTNIPVQPIRSSARVVSTPPKATEPRAESVPDNVSTEDKPLTPSQPAEVGKGFILKIMVTKNGSLTVTVDGSTPQIYELTVGDVIEWKAEKTIALDVSNADGIEVELNGKPYKQLGPSGKPVYVEFNSDGIKP
ncbi:MAG: DUF4115 domain-containing protein [Deltaproteobacteria bacterium]|nr:DUF4115 domain-containing protein [Deltaproteobacteria bacterium]